MSDKRIPIRFILPDSERAQKKRVISLFEQMGIITHATCRNGECNDCSCDKPQDGMIKDAPGAINLSSDLSGDKILSCISVLDTEQMQTNSDGHYEIMFLLHEDQLGPKLKADTEHVQFDGLEIVKDYVNRTLRILPTQPLLNSTLDQAPPVSPSSREFDTFPARMPRRL